jgi:aspartyl-tRNA(Asn)/glutamyl-tRNA(Gln) amidotransferase subunit A
MADASLTQGTLAGLAALIQGKQVSPVEVVEAHIARIEALEPRLNAFITRTFDAARAAAKQAEADIARGSYRGPLHGIPIAFKDLYWTKGVRTTSGSTVTGDFVPDEDATVVRLLTEAGAVSLGKTNMVEYAYGGTEHNEAYGPPCNPWDTGRITGGSSSGSAAAVASGEAAMALGSDTAGSIRGPASLCGLVGHKPTYGLVSRHGASPLCWSQDHVGPLTRTVEDAALTLNVIAGHDPLDPASAHAPGVDYAAALAGGVKGMRIGVPSNHVWASTHPEVRAAFEAALAVLEGEGASVEWVEVPGLDEISAAQVTITLAEATAYHRERIRTSPQMFHPGVRRRIETGLFLPAHAYVQAQRVRSWMEGNWAQAFSRFDLLATPTTPLAAPPFGASAVDSANGPVTTREIVRLTRLFNPNGLPACSVPCGFSSEGMPFGLQLAGRRFDDALVLRAAHAYEQAAGWHTRRPAL